MAVTSSYSGTGGKCKCTRKARAPPRPHLHDREPALLRDQRRRVQLRRDRALLERHRAEHDVQRLCGVVARWVTNLNVRHKSIGTQDCSQSCYMAVRRRP